MIDIQLLRMMRTRIDYNRLIGAVKMSSLNTITKKVIRIITEYYNKYPTHGCMDFTVFAPFLERKLVDGDDVQAYRNVIKSMAKDYPDEATRRGIMASVHEHGFAHTLQEQVNKYAEGAEIDLVQEVSKALDLHNNAVSSSDIPEVSENVDELLTTSEEDHGVHWRLPCLNRSMRGLVGGDFGIIAARPDQGKTSFLSSELTFMAPQTKDDRPIVWLNNEGPGSRIRVRLMQAALNMTFEELVTAKEDGSLYPKYWDAIGGKDRIRVMDIHGYNTNKVEAIMAATNPAITVYDMIDNVYGFGAGERNDLQLEHMYQWAREKAVKYDTIALATSQISVDGANMQYPPMNSLKDSKTGKQGACDFQLMIGSLENNPEYVNTRWLSLPKNKLRRTSGGVLNAQVTFNRDKSIYKEI